MKSKDKFEEQILKINRVFHEYRIAKVESYMRPNFESKDLIDAGIVVKPYNYDLLEEIVLYINQESRKFGKDTAIRIFYDSENNICHLTIKPDLSSPRTQWLEETENFISHIPHFINDYETRFRKR